MLAFYIALKLVTLFSALWTTVWDKNNKICITSKLHSEQERVGLQMILVAF